MYYCYIEKLLLLLISGTIAIAIGIAKRVSELLLLLLLLLRGLTELLLLVLLLLRGLPKLLLLLLIRNFTIAHVWPQATTTIHSRKMMLFVDVYV